MADNFEAGEAPNRNNRNNCSESYESYFKRAVDACEAGDLVLGMHLYLAAYEKAAIDPSIPDGMALAGLREAWGLACDLKERSLAEYVFEKLEPYLTGDEIAACAQQLQTMALDRLEQYGFSREELEGMAEMISQDFVGEGSVVKVESITIPGTTVVSMANKAYCDAQGDDGGASEDSAPVHPDVEPVLDVSAAQSERAGAGAGFAGVSGEGAQSAGSVRSGEAQPEEAQPEAAVASKANHVNMGPAPANDFNPYDMYRDYSIGKSYHCATNEGSGAHVFTRDEERERAGLLAKAQEQVQEQGREASSGASAQASEDARSHQGEALAPATAGTSSDDASTQAAGTTAVVPAAHADIEPSKAAPQALASSAAFTYSSLAGYDEAVALMRDFGIGLQNDESFKSFVQELNDQHGLDRAPSMDTLLVRAAVLEDAMRFVEATIGEIGLPALRMSMEEGVQGVPMLCVTTYGTSRPRMNHAHNRFEAPAILVIDDLDTWFMPSMPDGAEGMAGFVMANISRGAREAMNMIRAAVEDPDVFVLATATSDGDPDPFFYDILEPITVVDIGYPSDKERMDIWTEIAQNHPSMRLIDRDDLTRYSEGLSRYDIYMAAREAIEEAYKSGLVRRGYVPVSAQNIFEKIAAFQPLDSDAYKALEEKVIRDFQGDLDKLEDLINGSLG